MTAIARHPADPACQLMSERCNGKAKSYNNLDVNVN